MSEEVFHVSPLTIRFMLVCFYSPNPQDQIGDAVWNSAAGIETRTWLKDNLLVDADDRATERGRAWVERICATPLPIASWTYR